MVRCVITPHDALQFWKFAHHVADQIGFGDGGGALCVVNIGVELGCQIRSDVAHAADACALRA